MPYGTVVKEDLSKAAGHVGGTLPAVCDRLIGDNLPKRMIRYESVTSYTGKPLPDSQWPYRHIVIRREGPERALFRNSTSTRVEGGKLWVEHQLSNPNSSLFTRKPWAPEQLVAELSAIASEQREFVIQEAFATTNEPELQLAVTLAELGETIRWALPLFSRLLNVTRSFLMGGDFTSVAAKNIGAPNKLWLEYRYAVMPLVLELQAFRDYFMGKTVKKPTTVREGKTHEVDQRRTTIFNQSGWSRQRWEQQLTAQIHSSAAISVSGWDDPSPLGTGASDLVRAAWEVTNLSFVLDWFIDIGQWLASHRDANAEVGNRSATYVIQATLDSWVAGVEPGGYAKICAPSRENPIRYTYYVKDRIVGDSVRASFTPLWNPFNLSWMRQLDALSMIILALEGLARKTQKRKRKSRLPKIRKSL